MGVVMPRRAWVLVSETAEWHQSALPSTLFTNQYNLVLVTPLLRTPRIHAPDQCVAAIHRLTFLNGGLAWAGVGCGRAGGRLSLTANPFSLPDHLGNITIPVAVVKGSPTLRLVKTSDGEDYLDGFLGEMLRLLQRDLLFRVQVSQVPGFGNRLANGTWIGTVGAVARKEVELGLASLSISHIRNQVVDFSDYLISTGVYLMYLARQLTQPVSTVFLVFSPELWGCLLGQITLLGAVLYLACYRDAARRNHSPLYYLFASYRSFVYQGEKEEKEMNRCKGGWVDRWMDGWSDRWMDKWLDT
ncbi:glutamate receptor ionotropic, kainate 4-like [Scylla paramamosain]|uniref:glutamate receptor ionotropic, kainate 4-like n=1 Tax=Scylla paramamosain TaxID=85552 RepID=UPI0030827F0F